MCAFEILRQNYIFIWFGDWVFKKLS
jgi:hypothetical protein